MGHRSGFATPLYLPGFTPILQRELQLPGLLAHGLLEIQGRHTLLSVRPFVRQSWVQAHHALRRPTMASADFSLRRQAQQRNAGVALSGVRRDLPG